MFKLTNQKEGKKYLDIAIKWVNEVGMWDNFSGIAASSLAEWLANQDGFTFYYKRSNKIIPKEKENNNV